MKSLLILACTVAVGVTLATLLVHEPREAEACPQYTIKWVGQLSPGFEVDDYIELERITTGNESCGLTALTGKYEFRLASDCDDSGSPDLAHTFANVDDGIYQIKSIDGDCMKVCACQ